MSLDRTVSLDTQFLISGIPTNGNDVIKFAPNPKFSTLNFSALITQANYH